MNLECKYYDYGRTAPRAYGAFCEKKSKCICDIDCKECKEKELREIDER